MLVGTGGFIYEEVEGWPNIPDGWTIGTNAPITDSEDRVFVHCRGTYPMLVFDKNGDLLSYWEQDELGAGLAHGAYMDGEDRLYLPRCDRHVVLKYDADRNRLMTIGGWDRPSDTGSQSHKELPKRAAGPFNMPTDVAIAPWGDIYVSDGYGNSRIHRFNSDGELLRSWGAPGQSAPSEFFAPHSVWVHTDGRVLVADRNNNRVQIFGPDGEFLDQWRDLARPCDIYVDAGGIVYLAELDGFIRIMDLEGRTLSGWKYPGTTGLGDGAHAIWVDRSGDIYVNLHHEGRDLVKYRRVHID